jgi:hypothetical protein
VIRVLPKRALNVGGGIFALTNISVDSSNFFKADGERPCFQMTIF